MKNKKLKILYEDKCILVVYKESGLSTIKDKNHNINLYSMVYDYLHKKNQKVFIVHRLDRDTSGLVLFAKDEKIKNILQDNWEDVIRKYYTVVHGKTKKKGIIESYLKQTKSLYSYSTNDKKGEYAKTIYECILEKNNYSLLRIEIKTGRKNQIRVHMKDNNTPIVGDKKYGIKDNHKQMLLNAYYLCFNHPITKERIEIDTGVPKEYNSIMKK